MTQLQSKTKAIYLRKSGYSYSEILKQVPVAKSTLSLWLKDVNLSKPQKQRLTQKRIEAAQRGAQKRKTQRINLVEEIKKQAKDEIGQMDKKTFWMVGAALYWAEGSKQKENNVATGVLFSNSDPAMIKFFSRWLLKFCGISIKDIGYELYIHQSANIAVAQKYWMNVLQVESEKFSPVRIKQGNLKSYRKNKGKDYFGLVRISVKRSTNLNRRIMGWSEEVCKQFGIYSEIV